MSNHNNSKLIISELKESINKRDLETADELSLQKHELIDKGKLTSRECGDITKVLVEIGQENTIK